MSKHWTDVDHWIEKGFNHAEAEAMIEGSTAAQSRERQGGVWRVNYTEFAQAINADHARKLYLHAFGPHDPEDMDIRLT